MLLRTKKSRYAALLGFLIATTSLTTSMAIAQVTPADTNTSVSAAPNGVPVVNIATPNSKGLSHNRYTDYNVGTQGIVLNNGTNSQFEHQSQLAGAVQFNPNLSSAANTILNEVTSTNRTELLGYTEVLGQSAEVIIANPNGITCNGCGFINIPRATLTTGTPQVSLDNLTGYNIGSGDILITGSGLDASNQDYLGLFARSIAIAGQINSDELDIIAGANNIDHTTKVATPIAGSGSAPSLAIDSSVLGGMYANRIRLIATENGVGVRALSDVAAGSGDFVLSSSGKVEIGGTVSASQDISITTTANGADAFKVNSGSNISAGRDISLDISGQVNNAGNIVADGGDITANIGELFTNSGTIKSSGSSDYTFATGVTNTNTGEILASGDLYMRAASTNIYTIHNGNLIQSDGLLYIKGYNNGDRVDLYTDTTYENDVFGVPQISNAGQFLGQTGDIRTNIMNISDGGSIVTQGDLALRPVTLTMGGANARIIAAALGSGTGTFTFNSIDNRGLLFSGDDLTMTTNYITNRGGAAIAANGTLNITTKPGAYVFNYGDIYAGTTLNLNADSLFNYGTGSITGYDLNFTLWDAFLNTNDIIADRNMVVSSAGIYNQIPGGDSRFTQVTDHNITSTGWSRDPAWLWPSGSAHNYFTETWVVSTAYNGAAPTRGAMLHAGGTMTLRDFGIGHNLGSTISANTLNIGPASSFATFTNEDYDLSVTYKTRTWRNTASCCHGTLGQDTHYYAYLDDTTSSVSGTIPFNSSTGSGFYANTLNASGFTLVNQGGPSSESGTPNNTSISSAQSITASDLTLPTSTNGVFVTNKDPNAQYLVETNPLYQVNSTFRGSDYMIENYGVDPDEIDRRLGDAHYEASLIRKQVISSGAASLLVNATDEATAMQTMMDNGVSEGKKMGLTFGKAPTSEQIANLGNDIVWMVETEVNGVRVLAPVVYLSAATKSQISSGAVIEATNANLQLASLTNTGGTIIGRENLNVTSDGNIANISGQIKGGNISLASTNGSIINETYAQTTGGHGNQQTDIGKIAGIHATGNLHLKAGKDITNLGAEMSAGGNASLSAGRDIIFDTVVDKKSKATHHTSGGTFSGSSSSVTESSATNLKSGLNIAGNLSTDSGRDTTFAGTDVNVAGNADLNTGGNLNILARNDSKSTETKNTSGDSFGNGSSNLKTTTKTTNIGSQLNIGGNLSTTSRGDTTIQGSDLNVAGNGALNAGGNLNILDGQNTETTVTSRSKTGFGQGDGAYGSDQAVDLHYKSDSVASNLNFGGNAKLSSGKTITIQGSNIETKGNLGLEANDVQILEGRNIEITSTSRSKTGFAKPDSFSFNKDGTSSSGGSSASAGAGLGFGGGVTVGETNTKSTTRIQSTVASSNIKSGGNLEIKAQNDITVRGSNVEADGHVKLDAKNVNIMAAQNIDQTITSESSTKVGLYLDNQNNIGAAAGAGAGGSGFDGNGSPNGNANAGGNAGANSNTTLDLVRGEKSTSTVTDITHTSSTIRSGKNMSINADETLTVHGSDVVSRGDMELNATDMQFLAANDMHIETTNSESYRAGFYLDGSAGVDAALNGQAEGASGDVQGQGNASANSGAGLYGSRTTSGSVQGSSKAQTSMIKADGNLTRNAKNNITDIGTQIVAGGDFNQTAETWDSRAAQDTTFSSEQSRTDTAKAGAYGEANANASGQGGTNGFGKETDKGAGKGLQFGYNQTISGKTSGSSTAVVSNITAGGNVNTTTYGKASLEGTNMLSRKGDVNLNAGELDYKAAQNTTYSTEGGRVIDGDLKVGKQGGKLTGSYSDQNKNEFTSNAVTGNIYAQNGNINIKTDTDANFEGTNLNAGNNANIRAGGNVNFKAAKNTTMSSDSSLDVSGSVEASKNSQNKKSGSGEIEANYGTSINRSSEAVTGSIKSGGNINVSSGDNVTFEGTSLQTDGNANIGAKNDVNFLAAKDVSTEDSKQVGAKFKAGHKPGENGAGNENSAGGELSGGYARSKEINATGGTIEAGGKLNVNAGRDLNLEGTTIETSDSTNLSAGRDVNFKAATSSVDKVDVSGKVEAQGKKTGAGQDQNGQSNRGESEKEGGLEMRLTGEKSTSRSGGSINAGNINITSGRNTTLEGTQTQTVGETNIKAGGDVNLLAAQSTSTKGGIAGSASNSGGGLNQASVKHKTENQSTSIHSAGGINITSGGQTTLEATQIETGDTVKVSAKGGVMKQSTMDTELGAGLDHGAAEVTVQGVTITEQSKQALIPSVKTMTEAKIVRSQLQTALENVKNDITLTAAQKKEKIAYITEQNKALDKRISEIKKAR